ncbi:MAG TPA: cytochrome ubiquinol oxidase subunit I [Spirochaetia bacterium]|nr:cytochrome ubiquinol oxidase subunit I [Spirochaetia bacterium]
MSLILSRIQFAMSAGYHFIFPPTTLGLSFFIFLSETFHLTTKKEVYRKLSSFAVRILTLVFALGVATGLLLPFMFGMNWAEFAKHAGALFGVQLAVEATVAFTLESVFIGILFFGKDKIKPVWYWLSAFFVFFGSHLSGYIIIAANSWMQTPGGFTVDPNTGRMIMSDFWAFNFNTSVGIRFAHVVAAAWMVGAFLLVACAAWFLKHEKELDLAKKLMTVAGTIALVTAIAQPLIGHLSTLQIEQTQPAKGAAMEGIYETKKGADLYAMGWVDEQNKKVIGLPLPGMLSFFYTADFNYEVKGMNDPEVSKHGLPPVQWVFQNFRLMVLAGSISLGAILLALWFHRKNTLVQKKKSLTFMIYLAIAPYVAVVTGWFTAEIGRQPWVIYPVDSMGYKGLSTTDALTKNLDQGYVWFSIIAYFAVYAICTVVFLRFLPVIVKKGIDPQPAHGGAKE